MKKNIRYLSKEYKLGDVCMHTLPGEIHDYSHLWKDNEHMWIGSIDKKYFTFDGEQESFEDVSKFFTLRHWETMIPDGYEWDAEGDMSLENLVKMVWLTYEYFVNGFRNPIGSHWNPRYQSIFIHPGGCRNKILYFFHKGPIETVFFNTGGFYVDWMKNLRPIEYHELKREGWHGSVSPDLSALIPQVMKDVQSIPGEKAIWFDKIKQTLSDMRLNTNCEIEGYFLDDWRTDDDNHTVSIQFKNNVNPSMKDVIRSVLLALSGLDYKSKTLTVTHKK